METIVRLRIASDRLSPEDISLRVGLEPSRCWRPGDLRPQTIIRERETGWLVTSGLPESAELTEHVGALLARLRGRESALRELSATERVEVSCVIYSETEPTINLGPELIRGIANLGAGLDFDLYVLKD
jgi:hypothetical protein